MPFSAVQIGLATCDSNCGDSRLTLRNVRPHSSYKLRLLTLRLLPLRGRTCVWTSGCNLSFPIRAKRHERAFASRSRIAAQLRLSCYPTSSRIAQIARRVARLVLVEAFGRTCRCSWWRWSRHPIRDCNVTLEWLGIPHVGARCGLTEGGRLGRPRRPACNRLLHVFALFGGRRRQVVEDLKLVAIAVVSSPRRLCDSPLGSSFTRKCRGSQIWSLPRSA